MNWQILRQAFIYNSLALWKSMSLPLTFNNEHLSLRQILGMPVQPEVVEYARVKLLACKGDIKSQYDIAETLMKSSCPSGIGCPKDTEERQLEAIKWYKEAANQGDIESQACLGFIYECGEIYIRRDIAEALKWYKKAADQGDIQSKNYLLSKYKEEVKTASSINTHTIKFKTINYKI